MLEAYLLMGSLLVVCGVLALWTIAYWIVCWRQASRFELEAHRGDGEVYGPR